MRGTRARSSEQTQGWEQSSSLADLPCQPRGTGLAAASGPIRVLLVENGRPVGTSMRETLARIPDSDLETVSADSLEVALARIDEGVFDVALLDLELPDSSGIESFRRLHRSRPQMPVVILGEDTEQSTALEAVREGAQEILPVAQTDPGLVLHTIRFAIARHRALEDLRRREERLDLALDGCGDGVWDWDLHSETVFYSAGWNGMLGYPEVDQTDSPQRWYERVHDDDLPALKGVFEAHIRGSSDRLVHEHRMRNSAGHFRWVLARGRAVRDDLGRAVRVVGSLTDITSRKRAEEQLRHSALHDGLTGLANRLLLGDRISHALTRLRGRKGAHFAVIFFDLDSFKQINDSYGHAVGDALLVGIARRLQDSLRPEDTVARISGDEFAILVADVKDVGDAIHVAERLKALLACPFTMSGRELMVTASIGVALSSTGYQRAEDILHDADLAMYRAKSAGKARYQVFDPDMHRSAVALLTMESELREAVAEKQFVVHYQPVVSLASSRIVGFEGLVRWTHPSRGLLTPAQFIAIAEESGLIVPLGWWVLRESCRQARDWQDRFPADPPLWMSCNVSAKIFMQVDMVDRLIEMLEEVGLAPESLRLELTENVVLDYGEVAISRLLELRALGVQSSVDDFGTGYSSLSYLQRSQYDSLKIDPSFVNSIGGSGESGALVETILALASRLGIGVIAEGVETAEQFEGLRRLHCPQGQGFWFAEPLAPEAAERLLVSPPSW